MHPRDVGNLELDMDDRRHSQRVGAFGSHPEPSGLDTIASMYIATAQRRMGLAEDSDNEDSSCDDCHNQKHKKITKHRTKSASGGKGNHTDRSLDEEQKTRSPVGSPKGSSEKVKRSKEYRFSSEALGVVIIPDCDDDYDYDGDYDEDPEHVHHRKEWKRRFRGIFNATG